MHNIHPSIQFLKPLILFRVTGGSGAYPRGYGRDARTNPGWGGKAPQGALHTMYTRTKCKLSCRQYSDGAGKYLGHRKMEPCDSRNGRKDWG